MPDTRPDCTCGGDQYCVIHPRYKHAPVDLTPGVYGLIEDACEMGLPTLVRIWTRVKGELK